MAIKPWFRIRITKKCRIRYRIETHAGSRSALKPVRIQNTDIKGECHEVKILMNKFDAALI